MAAGGRVDAACNCHHSWLTSLQHTSSFSVTFSVDLTDICRGIIVYSSVVVVFFIFVVVVVVVAVCVCVTLCTVCVCVCVCVNVFFHK
jgi:hypothetical protein